MIQKSLVASKIIHILIIKKENTDYNFKIQTCSQFVTLSLRNKNNESFHCSLRYLRTPTLRYTGVRLGADALVASALQESSGGANLQQQQQPT